MECVCEDNATVISILLDTFFWGYLFLSLRHSPSNQPFFLNGGLVGAQPSPIAVTPLWERRMLPRRGREKPSNSIWRMTLQRWSICVCVLVASCWGCVCVSGDCFSLGIVLPGKFCSPKVYNFGVLLNCLNNWNLLKQNYLRCLSLEL